MSYVATERVFDLWDTLQRGLRPYVKSRAERYNVSPRTIQRDVQFLRSRGYNVCIRDGRVWYEGRI